VGGRKAADFLPEATKNPKAKFFSFLGGDFVLLESWLAVTVCTPG
jgi:hypothetical protein